MIYAITLILLILAPIGQLRGAARPSGPPHPARAPTPPVCQAELARVFAPPRPVWGKYEVCTVDAPVDAVEADGFVYAPLERLEALDAFGTAGAYDRSRLAQLYGGRRAEVLRGWRQTARAFESVVRISPYPDAALSRLHDGTMIIRWSAER